MAFCSYSIDQIAKQSVTLDNAFLNEFLPILPDYCVKVYLYGMYHCVNPQNADNTLESFARILNMSEDDIISAYTHLQELGLVQILKITPIEVRYLPVSKTSATMIKYNADKFKSFNKQAQELLKSRVLTPTEFNEYYFIIESLHLEPDALIMIIKYCVDTKGDDVGYKYIITVAKNWAYQGITTCEKVEDRLQNQEAADSDVKLLLQTMGIKKTATVQDYQMYLTWTNQLGFELPVLIYLASMVKDKGGMTRLDYLTDKFYKLRLLSKKEIETYLNQENELYRIAKQVCKNLGVRYDNFEIVVETYINTWVQQGFDFETLSLLSKNAFMLGLRTLNAFNEMVEKFYKMGLISVDGIQNYIDQSSQKDEKIKKILSDLGIVRSVNNFDRSYFDTWIIDWQISADLLDFAISKSIDKIQPMQFLNKLLSIYHSKGINTAVAAQKEKLEMLNNSYVNKNEKPNKRAQSRNYSEEQLKSLITTINEVEI